MWKDTTGRKVLVPAVVRSRGLLPWSVLPLVFAVGAGFFGFREGPPSTNGLARLVAVFCLVIFVVLLAVGLLQKRRS
jgi:uncharacterized membrane protein YtjA (UPF0391 family)